MAAAFLASMLSLPLDKTVTMFHVNPRRFGPVPVNMDTADPPGDFFFELFEVLSIPLACSDPTLPPWKKVAACVSRTLNCELCASLPDGSSPQIPP